jgi:hypothetical protein
MPERNNERDGSFGQRPATPSRIQKGRRPLTEGQRPASKPSPKPPTGGGGVTPGK